MVISIFSAISCILGVICILTGIAGLALINPDDPGHPRMKPKDTMQRRQLSGLLLSTGFLMLADVAAQILEGSPDPAHFRAFRFCIALDHLLPALSMYFYLKYVSELVECSPLFRLTRNAVYLICAVHSVITLASFRNGFFFSFTSDHYYQTGPGFHCMLMMFLFAMLLAFLAVLEERNLLPKSRLLILSCYILLPLILLIQQKFWFVRMQTPNIGLGLSVLFQSIVSGLERRQIIIQQQGRLIRQQEKLIQQEHELTRIQIRSAVSQMHPHFVFNVLNSIYVLIDQDPETAKTVVSSFSDYLRGIISAMETHSLIPFLQELGYIQKYLELEQIRYGDELKICYDTKETGFLVPPFSVQPLVENAVKHGVGKKPGGGTILIRTERAEKETRVIIHDDGVGFDPAGLQDDVQDSTEISGNDSGVADDAAGRWDDRSGKRIGIGYRNSRRRFRLLQKADVTVESAPGQGTTVTVTIPDPEDDETELPQ